MVRRNKKILGIIFIGVLLAGAGFYVWKTLTTEKYSDIKGFSNAVTISPQQGVKSKITIDFKDCSRGTTGFAFGLGSTSMAFSGIHNGKCRFFMGTEIENPRWNGQLTTVCNVPVSLGQRDFTVDIQGAHFGDFYKKYCKS